MVTIFSRRKIVDIIHIVLRLGFTLFLFFFSQGEIEGNFLAISLLGVIFVLRHVYILKNIISEKILFYSILLSEVLFSITTSVYTLGCCPDAHFEFIVNIVKISNSQPKLITHSFVTYLMIPLNILLLFVFEYGVVSNTIPTCSLIATINRFYIVGSYLLQFVLYIFRHVEMMQTLFETKVRIDNNKLFHMYFSQKYVQIVEKNLEVIKMRSKVAREYFLDNEMFLRRKSKELANYFGDNFKDIEFSTSKITYLLNDLKVLGTLDKLGNSKMRCTLEKVDVSQVVKNSVKFFEKSLKVFNFKDSKVEIYVNILDVPKYVICDKFRFSQIIHNIISNAIKYQRQDKSVKPTVDISLTYRKSKQQLVFICEDNGIGLSKEQLKKVFTPFVDLHKNTEKNVKSLGLGLSITRVVVKALFNGSIMIHSEGINKGASVVTKFEAEEISEEKEFVPKIDNLSVSFFNNKNYLDFSEQYWILKNRFEKGKNSFGVMFERLEDIYFNYHFIVTEVSVVIIQLLCLFCEPPMLKLAIGCLIWDAFYTFLMTIVLKSTFVWLDLPKRFIYLVLYHLFSSRETYVRFFIVAQAVDVLFYIRQDKLDEKMSRRKTMLASAFVMMCGGVFTILEFVPNFYYDAYVTEFGVPDQIDYMRFCMHIYIIFQVLLFIIFIVIQNSKGEKVKALEIELTKHQTNVQSRIVASIIHDLRAPIDIITLIFPTIQDDIEKMDYDEETKKFFSSFSEVLNSVLNDIIVANENISLFTSDIVNYYRIENKKVRIQRQSINLERYLHTSLKEMISRRRINLEMRFSEIPVKKNLSIDWGKLWKCLSGIIFFCHEEIIKRGNEGKMVLEASYITKKKAIEFTLFVPIRFTEKERVRLCDPLNNVTKNIFLRYYVGKKLMERMNGSLEMKSTKEGTIFSYVILSEICLQNQHSVIKNEKKIRILVVDDQNIYHKIIKNVLSKNSIECSVDDCYSGYSAVNKIIDMYMKGERYSFIFLDYHLGDMSGFEVLRNLRKFFRKRRIRIVLNVVLCTGKVDVDAHNYPEIVGVIDKMEGPLNYNFHFLKICKVLKKRLEKFY